MKFDDVLKALAAHKGDGTWQRVAEKTHLHYDTIARIARRDMESPSVQNVERIAAALLELCPELSAKA